MTRALRVLLVTSLDVRALPGSFEHHRASAYARRGCQVCVVYKRMSRSARLRDLVLETLTFRVRSEVVDGIRLVEVHPFFNYFAGLRRNVEERAPDGKRASRAKLLVLRVLSPLAVLRDVFFAPCATLAVLGLRERHDVCLGVGAWGGLAGWLARALGRVRLLVYEDRDYEPGLVPDRLRRWYTAAVERFAIRRADLVVSVGGRLAELRRVETGTSAAVLPCGVDWERFRVAREAHEARAPGSTLIYVGNLVSWSGVEPVIRALPALARRAPAVQLRIAGDGLPGYRERLRMLVAELGLEQRVEFLGARPPDELASLLAAADIGLACSEPVPFRRFACPLKVMEYMAAGLPVVVTSDTEASDVVTCARAGVCVEHDVAALERELGRLLEEPARCRELGAAGATYSRELDWDALIEREVALLAEVQRAGESAERAESAGERS